MAVALRLRRDGNRNRPFYRIVAADQRFPRDGRFIESIGTYNPLKETGNYTIDLERAEHWISQGAQPSETVASLIRKHKATEKATQE